MTSLADSLAGKIPQDKASDADDAYISDVEALAEFAALDIEPNIGMKELFARMLETKAYRLSVYQRLITGNLPPAVECKILDHVVGKPVDRIEIEDTTKSVDHLSLEELHERHNRTVAAMQKIIAAGQAEPRH